MSRGFFSRLLGLSTSTAAVKSSSHDLTSPDFGNVRQILGRTDVLVSSLNRSPTSSKRVPVSSLLHRVSTSLALGGNLLLPRAMFFPALSV